MIPVSSYDLCGKGGINIDEIDTKIKKSIDRGFVFIKWIIIALYSLLNIFTLNKIIIQLVNE
jgi:hypothetical protein